MSKLEAEASKQPERGKNKELRLEEKKFTQRINNFKFVSMC